MLQRLLRKTVKKANNQDTGNTTSQNLTQEVSGISMNIENAMMDKLENVSVSSVAQTPVEHIAESVSRFDDKNKLVQFGLDLMDQECQVSECVDDIEKKVNEHDVPVVVGHSASSDTLEFCVKVIDQNDENAELCNFSSTSSMSKSSDDNISMSLPAINNGPLSKECDSVLCDLQRSLDGSEECKMHQYSEVETYVNEVTRTVENNHGSQNNNAMCESSSEDDSDVADSKSSESTDKRTCDPEMFSATGAGFAMHKCKSDSGLHAFVDNKDGQSMSVKHALSHSFLSMSMSSKDLSGNEETSGFGIKFNESLHSVAKDTEAEVFCCRNKESIEPKLTGKPKSEDDLLNSCGVDRECLRNVSTPVMPKGSVVGNGNEVKSARSDYVFPSLENNSDNEVNISNEKNSEPLEWKVKDVEEVSRLVPEPCLEKVHSSEFAQVFVERATNGIPNYASEIPSKDIYNMFSENAPSHSESRGNIKTCVESVKPVKRSRSRRKKHLSESASLLKMSVDSDEETKYGLKPRRELFTIYSTCHNCACCTYSCLYNYSGLLCTLFGKQYIFAEIQGVPMLVCLHEENLEASIKNCCKLLWREQSPLVMSHIEDGVEVMFDAVLMPELNRFVALVVWHTCKPSVATLPKEEYLMFLEEVTGFQVQLVSLNAKKTGVETGVVKATIDGQEETVLFSAEVVFLNGAKVSNHVDLLSFFQYAATKIYVTVNKFFLTGSCDKYVYIPTCIWRGSKPSNLLLNPPVNRSKLYNPHVSGTLPQELEHYSTLHCDVPCTLFLSEGGRDFTSSERSFHLKFILDNKVQLLECSLDRFYCKNRHVALIGSCLAFSTIVKAHILQHRFEENVEKFEVIMVQVPEEIVAATLSKSDTSLNTVQKLGVTDRGRSETPDNFVKDPSLVSSLKSSSASPSYIDQNTECSNLTLTERPTASREVHPSNNYACDVLTCKSQYHDPSTLDKGTPSSFRFSFNLPQCSSHDSLSEIAAVKEDNTSSMQLCKSNRAVFGNFSSSKVGCTIKSPQSEGDRLLAIVSDNSNSLSKSSEPGSASAKLCDSSLSRTQLATLPGTPLPNSNDNSFRLPLEIDIPHISPAEHSNCSSASLQYFSPVLGSPMSSCSSYTSLSQVSSTKATTTKKICLPYLPAGQWSFGMPVPASVSNKVDSGSSENKVKVNTKTSASYSEVVQKPSKSEPSSNVSIANQCQNPPQSVNNAKGKSGEGSSGKVIIYKALCTVKKIAAKTGILIVRGNILSVSYPKAYFHSKVLYANGASLTGGDVNVFKPRIEPLMNKEWTCLLQQCKPINTSGVNVKLSALLMWIGAVPQARFAELQKYYKITNVVPLKQLKPNVETASRAAQGGPTKVVPTVPSPKPQPVLLRGLVVAVESTAGKLKSVGSGNKETQFTRKICFLYNICLEKVCLKDVLPCGLEVIYEEVNGKVKKVILEGSYRDADLLDPATRYKLLKSWCEQYSVPSVSTDILLVAGGWLPPELNPTATQESKKAVVNLG
ncbi:uncharacterized protein LOC135226436 [Macrobrachium nipponense]|uniref:uncharacterized protein LOC135226436 n=1 Tax=Macrobrachium nipponense TaxID=159736 RepID=UPI0030C7F1B0